MEKSKIYDDIQTYYGTILENKNDLKTTACCAIQSPPKHIKEALRFVPQEVQAKFYGCGLPFPTGLQNCRVLDLGSGTGRDCFVLSSLVGQKGSVLGIDMTPNQLEVAHRHNEAVAKSLGYTKPNVDFRQGYIEDLAAADVGTGSMDLVISNCVVNLSPRKDLVLSEIFRVLKTGGELYFSDVFVDRRLSTELQNDAVIVGECLGGALYWEDFRRLMQKVGFLDFRVVARNPIEVTNEEIRTKLGSAVFQSVTVRAFKVDLEDTCEDYGQAAAYNGTDPYFPQSFKLDDHHVFEANKLVPICRNTANMLMQSRFAKYFDLFGKGTEHYGKFDCGTEPSTQSSSEGACC
jgi:arsenite methyltransferase